MSEIRDTQNTAFALAPMASEFTNNGQGVTRESMRAFRLSEGLPESLGSISVVSAVRAGSVNTAPEAPATPEIG